jgi:hypothetical protein
VFDEYMIGHLGKFVSKAHIQTKVRELTAYMQKLGLDKITYDLWEQMHKGSEKPVTRKTKHAKTAH